MGRSMTGSWVVHVVRTRPDWREKVREAGAEPERVLTEAELPEERGRGAARLERSCPSSQNGA